MWFAWQFCCSMEGEWILFVVGLFAKLFMNNSKPAFLKNLGGSTVMTIQMNTFTNPTIKIIPIYSSKETGARIPDQLLALQYLETQVFYLGLYHKGITSM